MLAINLYFALGLAYVIGRRTGEQWDGGIKSPYLQALFVLMFTTHWPFYIVESIYHAWIKPVLKNFKKRQLAMPTLQDTEQS